MDSKELQQAKSRTIKNKQIQNPDAEVVSGRAIRSFHPLNYSLYVSRLFPFQHPELPATRRAGRDKVQFLMRRQHQMVAFTAPGHMVAKSTSVGRFPVFPLDRDIFIESGHSLPPEMHSMPAACRIKRKHEPAASNRFPRASKFSLVAQNTMIRRSCQRVSDEHEPDRAGLNNPLGKRVIFVRCMNRLSDSSPLSGERLPKITFTDNFLD